MAEDAELNPTDYRLEVERRIAVLPPAQQADYRRRFEALGVLPPQKDGAVREGIQGVAAGLTGFARGAGASLLDKTGVGSLDTAARNYEATHQQNQPYEGYEPTDSFTSLPALAYTLGQGAGSTIPSLAATAAGGLIGGTLGGTVGAAAGAKALGGITTYAQMYGTNVEEYTKKLPNMGYDDIRALAAVSALGQAMVEQGFGPQAMVGRGMGNLFAKVADETAPKVAAQMAKAGVWSVWKSLLKGGAEGAYEEGGEEGVQLAIDHIALMFGGADKENLPKVREYIQNTVAGALAGGFLGAPAGAFEGATEYVAGTRREEYIRRKAEAQAALDAEQARPLPPEDTSRPQGPTVAPQESTQVESEPTAVAPGQEPVAAPAPEPPPAPEDVQAATEAQIAHPLSDLNDQVNSAVLDAVNQTGMVPEAPQATPDVAPATPDVAAPAPAVEPAEPLPATEAAAQDKTETAADRIARIRATPNNERRQEDVDWANQHQRAEAAGRNAAEEAKRQEAIKATPAWKYSTTFDSPRRQRVMAVLGRTRSVNGKLATLAEAVEERVAQGWRVTTRPDGKRALAHPDGRFLTETDLSKTALDYAEHLAQQPVTPVTPVTAAPPTQESPNVEANPEAAPVQQQAPEGVPGPVAQKPPELMTADEHASQWQGRAQSGPPAQYRATEDALKNRRPVLAENVDRTKIDDFPIVLPAGYVREGDRYVFKGESAQAPAAEEKPSRRKLAENARRLKKEIEAALSEEATAPAQEPVSAVKAVTADEAYGQVQPVPQWYKDVSTGTRANVTFTTDEVQGEKGLYVRHPHTKERTLVARFKGNGTEAVRRKRSLVEWADPAKAEPTASDDPAPSGKRAESGEALRDSHVPASAAVFAMAGLDPAPIYADYEWLQRKHPKQYATQEEAKGDVEFVLQAPEFAAPGNEPTNVIFDRSGKENVRVALTVEKVGKAYHVRSVHRISETQYAEDRRRRFSPDSVARGIGEHLGQTSATDRVTPSRVEVKPTTLAPAVPQAEPSTKEAPQANPDADLDAEFADLARQMREKLNRLSSGVDPEIAVIGTKMAYNRVKKGTRQFSRFAADMRRALPEQWEALKGYLHGFWTLNRQHPDFAGDEAAIEDLTGAQAKALIAAIDATGPAPAEVKIVTQPISAPSVPGAPSFRLLLELTRKQSAADARAREIGRDVAKAQEQIDSLETKPRPKTAKAYEERRRQLTELYRYKNGLTKEKDALLSAMHRAWQGKDVEWSDWSEYLSQGKDIPADRRELYPDYFDTSGTETETDPAVGTEQPAELVVEPAPERNLDMEMRNALMVTADSPYALRPIVEDIERFYADAAKYGYSTAQAQTWLLQQNLAPRTRERVGDMAQAKEQENPAPEVAQPERFPDAVSARSDGGFVNYLNAQGEVVGTRKFGDAKAALRTALDFNREAYDKEQAENPEPVARRPAIGHEFPVYDLSEKGPRLSITYMGPYIRMEVTDAKGEPLAVEPYLKTVRVVNSPDGDALGRVIQSHLNMMKSGLQVTGGGMNQLQPWLNSIYAADPSTVDREDRAHMRTLFKTVPVPAKTEKQAEAERKGSVKQLKVQKDFLTAALDKLAAEAPAQRDAGYPMKTVSIEVPDDGTFTINFTKESIALLKKRMSGHNGIRPFSASAWMQHDNTLGDPSQPPRPPKVNPEKVTLDDATKVAQAFVSEDETRVVIQSVNWNPSEKRLEASDGRMAILVPQPEGKDWGTGKTVVGFPDIGKVVPTEWKETATVDAAQAWQKARFAVTVRTSAETESRAAVLIGPDGQLAITAPEADGLSYQSDNAPGGRLVGYADVGLLMTVIDGLMRLGNSSFTIEWTEGERLPIRFTGVQTGALAVLMPTTYDASEKEKATQSEADAAMTRREIVVAEKRQARQKLEEEAKTEGISFVPTATDDALRGLIEIKKKDKAQEVAAYNEFDGQIAGQRFGAFLDTESVQRTFNPLTEAIAASRRLTGDQRAELLDKLSKARAAAEDSVRLYRLNRDYRNRLDDFAQIPVPDSDQRGAGEALRAEIASADMPQVYRDELTERADAILQGKVHPWQMSERDYMAKGRKMHPAGQPATLAAQDAALAVAGAEKRLVEVSRKYRVSEAMRSTRPGVKDARDAYKAAKESEAKATKAVEPYYSHEYHVQQAVKDGLPVPQDILDHYGMELGRDWAYAELERRDAAGREAAVAPQEKATGGSPAELADQWLVDAERREKPETGVHSGDDKQFNATVSGQKYMAARGSRVAILRALNAMVLKGRPSLAYEDYQIDNVADENIDAVRDYLIKASRALADASYPTASVTPAAGPVEVPDETRLRQVAEAFRKPMPQIIPVVESEGDNGKWYAGLNSNPVGVKFTGQRRTVGYTYTDRNGNFGVLHKTEQAARDWWNVRQNESVSIELDELRKMTPEQVAKQERDLKLSPPQTSTDRDGNPQTQAAEVLDKAAAASSTPQDLAAAAGFSVVESRKVGQTTTEVLVSPYMDQSDPNARRKAEGELLQGPAGKRYAIDFPANDRIRFQDMNPLAESSAATPPANPAAAALKQAADTEAELADSDAATGMEETGADAKAEAPSAAAEEVAKAERPGAIEDAGEKIGGARKDKWKERGLTLADLEEMTPAERAKYATKANVWPLPDYAALATSGKDPEALALMKGIRDRLATMPREDTEQGRQNYVQAVAAIREAIENEPTAQGVAKAFGAVRASQQTIMWSTVPAHKYRMTMGIGYAERQAARKLIEAGFPESKPWLKVWNIHEYSIGSTEITHHSDGTRTDRKLTATEYAVGPKTRAAAVNAAPRPEKRFTSRAEAEAWLKEHWQDRRQERHDEGKPPERPHLDRHTRAGFDDRRGGVDKGSEDLVREFGFRGVEFGNWAAGDERQTAMNLTYDALCDLAELLGIPRRALSLNGTLGLAFGARGGGNFAAHYEPGKVVINLTKLRGGGSVIHEWAHALDHYLGELDTEKPYGGLARWVSGERVAGGNAAANLREEMRQALRDVMIAIVRKPIIREAEIARLRQDLEKYKSANQNHPWVVATRKRLAGIEDGTITDLGREDSDYLTAAKKLCGKSGDYWKRPHELFARAFEAFVFDRMAEVPGRGNSWLVHGVEADRYSESDGYKGNPYPTGQERERIDEAFGTLFATMKTRETDKGVAMYRTAPEGQEEQGPTTSMAEARALWTRMFGSDEDLRDVSALLAPDGLKALGRWTGAWAEIASGQANPSDTAMHEAVHKALSLFLSAEDRARLVAAAGGEEKLAENILKYARDGKGFVGRAQRIVERLLRVLRRYFGTQAAQDKVRDFYDQLLGGGFASREEMGVAGEPAMAYRKVGGEVPPDYGDTDAERMQKRERLQAMAPVNVNTAEFGTERDPDTLRVIGEAEYGKLVGTKINNLDDGRTITFSEEQFGKPKSHSADPRIMRLIPSLPVLLKNAVHLFRKDDRNPLEHRNIVGWHTYGVRALVDGQDAYVLLTTFEEKSGEQFISLYHDHNVTWAEVMRKGTAAGPDPVTNRGVSQGALLKNTLYQWWNSVKSDEPGTQEPHYRTAAQATATAQEAAVTRALSEHFDNARGWVGDFLAMRKRKDVNLRPDITKADRLLRTIANYAKKVPALKLIFQAALDFSTNRHLYGERIFGLGEMLVGDLAKFVKDNGEAWKARVEPYLWEQDMNAVGPRVAKEGDEWVIYSAAKERLGATTSEVQAWTAAHLAEVQELLADGWTEAEAEAVFKVRTINDNTWSMLAEDARRMIAEAEALGMAPPPIVLADGTAIDLQQALREMGDRRGYYMPRLRKAGRYELLATKEGANPIREHFDTNAGRAVRAVSLERDGYAITLKRSDRPSEEAYLDASAAAVEDLVNNALGRMGSDVDSGDYARVGLKAEWETYHRKTDGQDERHFVVTGEFKRRANEVFKDFGGYWDSSEKAWHFPNPDKNLKKSMLRALLHVKYGELMPSEAFAKTMAETMATVLHSRGSQARKIGRSEATGVNVWEGYETDALKAVTMTGKATAAGAAKRRMVQDMMKAFTGRDESWQEFKARRMAENEAAGEHVPAASLWDEYDEQVKERRIDSAGQPEASAEGISYMREMARNEEPSERLLGIVKGLAAFKYLSGIAPAAVNLTALLTTVPAAMNGFGHIALSRCPILLSRGIDRYSRFYMHRKFGKGSGISGDDAWLFEEINRRGWDEQQMNREAIGVLQNWGEAKMAWLTEKAMLPFGVTERINRAATIAAAYWGLAEKHEGQLTASDRAQYLERAKEIGDKAHAVYGKANLPSWARGSSWAAQGARAFYMYKTFSHNFLQILWELGVEKREAAAVMTLMLAPALIGGVGAVAGKDLIKGILEALLGIIPGYEPPDDIEEAIYQAAERTFGQVGERTARAGLGGLVGVDLRGSLAVALTDVPTSIGDLLGAPWSVMKDLGGGVAAMAHGDVMKGAEKLAPRFAAGPLKAIREGTEGVTTASNQPVYYGNEKLRASMLDVAYRAAGFSPARLSTIREKQWNERKTAQSYDETRSDIYRRVRAYYNESAGSRDPEDWADILGMIEQYNARVTRNSSPSPFISRDVLRRIATQSARAPRREMLRSAAELEDREDPVLPTTAPEPTAAGESRRDRYRRERRGRGERQAKV